MVDFERLHRRTRTVVRIGDWNRHRDVPRLSAPDFLDLDQAPKIRITVIQRHIIDGLGEGPPGNVRHLPDAGRSSNWIKISTVRVDNLPPFVGEIGFVSIQLSAVGGPDYLDKGFRTKTGPGANQQEWGVIGGVVLMEVGKEERCCILEERRSRSRFYRLANLWNFPNWTPRTVGWWRLVPGRRYRSYLQRPGPMWNSYGLCPATTTRRPLYQEARAEFYNHLHWRSYARGVYSAACYWQRGN